MDVMRRGKDRLRVAGEEGLRLEQRVQLARGHWLREEQAGAVRSAGWWESVTITWSPAAAPARRPTLLQRALATAVDAVTPAMTELAVAGARRLLERRPGIRAVLPSSRRRLPAARKALPPAQ
jgi:hypothetical protein